MIKQVVVSIRDVAVYHSRDSFRDFKHSAKKGGLDLVLSDVNFDVSPGELVYLIGRVGSGKSTLIKTLYAEIPLCEGTANVAGYSLHKISRKDIPYLRRRIGIVFQDYELLLDRNVYQNLSFVLKATGWRDEVQISIKIGEVLEQVGLLNKEYKMPFELSGGEQQRLSIARALLNTPELILADEPTANLDPAAADEIMTLLYNITLGGCAVIMSTHNIGNIQQYPARTLRFNCGKIEEIDVYSILGI